MAGQPSGSRGDGNHAIPYMPRSHPFVERLIGTVRREYLGCTLFWTTADLETKLFDFQHYYSGHRTHVGWQVACQSRALTDLHPPPSARISAMSRTQPAHVL
jgi:hypothetical protein